MSIICYFRKHNWKHIANWSDITGGRGLYQCTRCKEVTIDMSSEYHIKQKKENKWTRINSGDY